MPFDVPAFDTLRQRHLRDLQNQSPDADVSTDSDNFARASATSSAVEGLYRHQQWMAAQLLPDTADPEYLEYHASLRGITRKAATTATGTLALTGEAGAEIPSGTVARHTSGLTVQTTAAAAIGEAGTATVACAATAAGAVADYTGEAVVLEAAPSGVQSQALLTLSGGTDTETDTELLDRLLDYMRNPPGGGTAKDYRRWAREVPGVTQAWVFPLRRGLGTVDVLISSGGGLPTPELVAAVQAHIDEMRPTTAKGAFVLSPADMPVDVQAKVRLSGTTLGLVRSQAQALLESYLRGLLPGGLVVRARLEALLLSLPGVVDAQVLLPAANVQAGDVYWPQLGVFTLEVL